MTYFFIFALFNINEALSLLGDIGNNFTSADLHMLPPDSSFSGGISDNEDQPERINHLLKKHLDAQAEVLFHYNATNDAYNQQL